MLQMLKNAPAQDLLEWISHTDNAAFILKVESDETMRFLGLNAAHERITGLTTSAIAGKTPHEALPPRIADTVSANYRTCLNSKRPYTYEEVLELPHGRNWWRTTLTPLIRNRRVFAIVGEAIDITAYKTEAATLADETSRVRQRLMESEIFAKSSVNATRGAFNNIVSLLRMLKSELPTGDREEALLDLVMETACTAIATIDVVEARENGRRTAVNKGPIDLGHLCRDFAALVDPGHNLHLIFPTSTVEADREALSVMLRHGMEEAASCAATRISVTVTPDALLPGNLAILLDFDCLDQADPAIGDLSSRGDALGVSVRLDRDMESGLHRLKLSLPGKCLDDLH